MKKLYIITILILLFVIGSLLYLNSQLTIHYTKVLQVEQKIYEFGAQMDELQQAIEYTQYRIDMIAMGVE